MSRFNLITCIGLKQVLLSILIMVTTNNIGFAQGRLSQTKVIDGFNKTVFGSEYAPLGFQRFFVRKFSGEVRFYIEDTAQKNRGRSVRRFIQSLPRSIRGLKTRIVKNPKDSNFQVYIVDKKDYADTVRSKIYRNRNARVVGRCFVRSVFSRKTIRKSTAVVVSDRGERLFKRCMVEEILQGLGPLNEDHSLKYSVFNDKSRQTSFTRFDRIIMNMLYDKRLKAGTSQKGAQKLLPSLYKSARRRVR